MELIDRTALLEKSYYRGRPATVNNPWPDGAEVVDVEDIEAMPAVDAALVVHGWWEWTGSCQVCSVCGEEQYGIDTGRYYCPNCGAKMDGRR